MQIIKSGETSGAFHGVNFRVLLRNKNTEFFYCIYPFCFGQPIGTELTPGLTLRLTLACWELSSVHGRVEMTQNE